MSLPPGGRRHGWRDSGGEGSPCDLLALPPHGGDGSLSAMGRRGQPALPAQAGRSVALCAHCVHGIGDLWRACLQQVCSCHLSVSICSLSASVPRSGDPPTMSNIFLIVLSAVVTCGQRSSTVPLGLFQASADPACVSRRPARSDSSSHQLLPRLGLGLCLSVSLSASLTPETQQY